MGGSKSNSNASKSGQNSNANVEVLNPKRSYIIKLRTSEMNGTEIYDGENYPTFPIIPLWGNPHHQSELVGLREQILQGESIGNIATRLANKVGDSDRKASIRNARTMATGVHNAGRMDSYKRAKSMGIDVMQEWIATLDGRTRHEHRVLDRQRVKVGEKFKAEGHEIRYPGDPTAEPVMIYNCRYTLVPCLPGISSDANSIRKLDPKLQEKTYEEWKASRKTYSDPITKQDEIAARMAGMYSREYAKYARNTGQSGLMSGDGDGTMNQALSAGLGASDTVNESIKHRPPDELEKIDYSDEIAVRNTLWKYEQIIADEPIENAIVICRDGTVVRCYGTLNGVYPHEDLGDRLIGATVTHNHPIGSDNEYSFSKKDINLFINYKLDTLRGIDEKYVYELTRNSKNLDKQPTLAEALLKEGEMTRHSIVISIAEDLKIGYTRKARR